MAQPGQHPVEQVRLPPIAVERSKDDREEKAPDSLNQEQQPQNGDREGLIHVLPGAGKTESPAQALSAGIWVRLAEVKVPIPSSSRLARRIAPNSDEECPRWLPACSRAAAAAREAAADRQWDRGRAATVRCQSRHRGRCRWRD